MSFVLSCCSTADMPAEYFERRDIRHLEREKGISFMRLPEAMNPFGIKRSEFGFFEAIL